MIRIATTLLLGIFFLTACGQSTVVPAIPTATSTPSVPPTTLQTLVPSVTPTASITPLPTIPTFTPTFDVSTIVTVTPAPKAGCPKEDSSVVAKFATPDSNGSYEMYSSPDVLDYLNSGGTLDQLEKYPRGTSLEKIVDLTGDGLSEVVYRNLPSYAILGCKDGQYQDLFDFAPEIDAFSIDLENVLDLNRDGIPELIFYKFSHYGYAEIYIFEWDGSKFRSLIDVGTDEFTGAVIDYVSITADYNLLDTNEDGIKEIVLEDDPHFFEKEPNTLWLLIPFRKETITLGWNGKNFINLKPENYGRSEYRFQAIQDGDRQARYGKYSEALSLYQEAFFNDQLAWWSPARREYEINTFNARLANNPTDYPTSIPAIPDNTEYPRLAAYAYYRIVLLHLVQNHESDATTVYNTLQQKFGSDPYGRPYVEMATAFWNAYQSTHKMYDGCAAAIQYAVEHPEILIPLGSDYHGSQSHIYVPADVCPFR